MEGGIEGELGETTGGSAVFDAFSAAFKVAREEGSERVEFTASGTLAEWSCIDYQDTSLAFKADSFAGKAVGVYSNPLSLVLTSVTIADAASNDRVLAVLAAHPELRR